MFSESSKEASLEEIYARKLFFSTQVNYFYGKSVFSDMIKLKSEMEIAPNALGGP